jgi:hypothetical protein
MMNVNEHLFVLIGLPEASIILTPLVSRVHGLLRNVTS